MLIIMKIYHIFLSLCRRKGIQKQLRQPRKPLRNGIHPPHQVCLHFGAISKNRLLQFFDGILRFVSQCLNVLRRFLFLAAVGRQTRKINRKIRQPPVGILFLQCRRKVLYHRDLVRQQLMIAAKFALICHLPCLFQLIARIVQSSLHALPNQRKPAAGIYRFPLRKEKALRQLL